jgi:hypothetical protein
MAQYLLTVAAAKRLIGRALATHPAIKQALSSATLVIIAGTTNGYVAEKISRELGSWLRGIAMNEEYNMV